MVWIAAALAQAGTATADPPTAPDPGAYTANGPVWAIAAGGGRTYIGGDFTRVGIRSGSGAVLSSSDGGRQAFPEVSGGDVRAAVSDGSGGWYIGGSFTSVGGEPHVGLAHINASGSVDSGFTPAATDLQGSPSAVDALAYEPSHGALYVGGEFSRIGLLAGPRQFHSHLAALHAADGSPIPQFAPTTDCATGQPCSGAVQALTVAHVPLTVNSQPASEPVVFAGGDFGMSGPSDNLKPTQGIAAFWGVGAEATDGTATDGSAVTDTGPSPWSAGLSAGSVVDSLKIAPDNSTTFAVYVGGHTPTDALLEAHQFTMSPFDPAHRETATQQKFSNWTPGPTGCDGAGCTPSVNTLALSGDGKTLYFAGDFKAVQGQSASVPATRVATISTVPDDTKPSDSTHTTASPFGAGAAGPVRALALSSDGTKLYVAGDMPGPDGSAPGLSALSTADGSPAAWAPAPDDGAEALATDASSAFVYVGGRFSSLGSVARGGLAAFDSTGALLGWNPAVTSTSATPPLVRALTATDSTVYVGGHFDRVSGQDRANLAAVSAGDGSAIGGFQPNPSVGSGSNASVTSLALLGSTLYVGGRFDQVGGQNRTDLAAVDAGSGAASTWNPSPDDVVHAILPACGSIYVGGGFSNVGGQPRDDIAALDPGTGAATSWDPSADGAVLGLSRFGQTIYAGGNFATIGGQLRQKLAGLTIADGTATPFDPAANGPVRTLAASDTTLYAGGVFSEIGGASRTYLAALDPSSGAATGWAPSPDGAVDVVALGNDALFAGGGFNGFGPVPQRGFAPFGSGAGSPFSSDACSVSPKSGAPPSNPPVVPACSGSKPPRIGHLAIKPKRLRLPKGRLQVRFRISRCAPVRLRFDRLKRVRCHRKRGRRGGGHTCTRYVRFATVSGNARRGSNRLTFARGRVGRKRLRPGSYRLTMTSKPALRAASVRRPSFTVMAAPRKHRGRRK